MILVSASECYSFSTSLWLINLTEIKQQTFFSEISQLTFPGYFVRHSFGSAC